MKQQKVSPVKDFIEHHFRHFNGAALKDAAVGWIDHLDKGGKMMVTLGGAMSTAELGISLAALIRADKVHAICCTGANLEEDIFNLVAHDHYKRIPKYRDLTAAQEVELRDQGMNRVTDTCIPEELALKFIDKHVINLWKKADQSGESYFPHEYLYELLRSGILDANHQIPAEHSWMIAACEKNLPIFVPGWEDSSLGNVFVSQVINKNLSSYAAIKSGLAYMENLVQWYQSIEKDHSIGFFQIGGGISGDFPICAVPLIRQDLLQDCRYWGYFCQISDSTTSYGSYSGAVPNEKITWGKLDVDTPSYIIESDATICAPLIFQYILES
jgi:deoxyhypusine synthase